MLRVFQATPAASSAAHRRGLSGSVFSAPARVFLGAGNGAFLAEKTFKGSGNNVFNLCAVDLNRDGLPDLVLGDGSERKISVLLNTTPR